MAELSQSERDAIARAVKDAFAEEWSGAAPAGGGAAAAPADIPDPKKFFCQNWPATKGVLEFLLDFLPDNLKAIVRKLIAAGDRIHALICR